MIFLNYHCKKNSYKFIKLDPLAFFKLNFKLFHSFLLIRFDVKLINLFLLTYKQIYNKRVCKSRKHAWKSSYQLPHTILYETKYIRRKPLRKKCPYLELFWSVFSRIPTEHGEIRSKYGPE